jgi:DHA1 family tetracycline resistance protein-like MFS transporter
VIVQGGLVRIIVPRFGERRVIFFGFLMSAIMSLYLPFVAVSWMVYLGTVIHIIGWGSASPALQGLMSKLVPENQQGLLQGTLTSINSIGMIIGPLMASQIFALATGRYAHFGYPGAWFFFGALFYLLAMLVIFIDSFRIRRNGDSP